MATKIQVRRDTANNWETENPVLAAGEFGYATDTKVLKVGDGLSNWSKQENGQTVDDLPAIIDGDYDFESIPSYVQKDGDTMTGQLTLPGGGSGAEAIQVQEAEALINAIDNTDYVSKTDTASQNIVSDLTLGTDKITLDATDGSVRCNKLTAQTQLQTGKTENVSAVLRFITKNTVKEWYNNETKNIFGYYDRDAGAYTFAIDYDTQSVYIGTQVDRGDLGAPARAITLNTDGSAEFAGQVDAFNFRAQSSQLQFGNLSSTKLWLNSDDANKSDTIFQIGYGIDGSTQAQVKITAEGDAEFAGDVKIGGTLPDDPNISLNADGSAEFAGTVTISSAGAATKPIYGATAVTQSLNALHSTFWAHNTTANGNAFVAVAHNNHQQQNVIIKENGSAEFVGNITAGNVSFNLEPDNPANYTTTTDSEGNETRVYNGPTLDVKDRLQNLLSRLDAIEANEVIDDATDSSLLQLVASASARLDSLEARIAVLEGGN
jgi:hypothetical protein